MMTARQQMTDLLTGDEYDARELSQQVRICEKEVYDHLVHIAKSLPRRKQKLRVTPPVCLSCGYRFRDRTRFTKPSRCPKCKSERIDSPRFEIINI
ncbi:transcriptional regulator [Desulfonema ishimotonii]|uniref:Transcriptional regulator n=1 Tax=Desulfonema ishimotonii TaxID=45657 RepID=A0A401FSF5_9BACT|nr:transcriptional regulator [Desulfonema ishimotonii]